MSLFEAKLEIPAPAAEATDEVLLELGNGAWSVVQDVIVMRAWVIGMFADEGQAQAAIAVLLPLLPEPPLEVPAVRELADAEWRDSYKAHFHAWQFGRLHWVPVWERAKYQVPPGDAVLWLDPGLAFGTGNHETTRLCVERLVEFASRHGTSARVVDAGCGSGILALSAARLGFRAVSGFDNDPEAVRVSGENAALNDLTGSVDFFVGDLVTGLAGVHADVLMANILADVLIRHARELTAAVAPGGTLILSGILSSESQVVRSAFAALVPDWVQESRTMGEWTDVLLTRSV